MKLIVPKEVIDFMSAFRKAGYEIYIVGGAVRDLLIGRNPPAGGDNWDFTTNATPEEIQKLFPDSFYNNNFGTVSVRSKKSIFEITPYRTEGAYTDRRHPDTVSWGKTLKEDLSRRDFTINAMAYDGENIVDIYGGREHLAQKLIVAVGDPDTRFAEDALRLMRAVRLASQLGFLLDAPTQQSIKKNASLIHNVSQERVRDELLKILASDNPADGVLFLKNTGLLAYILPEVDVCFTVAQKSPGRHHIYDVGTHLMMALKLCPNPDPIVRLATLLHDIGKAPTFNKDDSTGLITFFNHEHVGADMTRQIAERLRLSKQEKHKLTTLVRYHMFTVSEKQTDKAIRRFIRNVGKEYLMDILDLRVADRLGSGARITSWRTELFKKRLEEVQQEPFKITDLKINGNDVMSELNIAPGRRIGEILQNIFYEVERGALKNERDDLLTYLRRDSKNDNKGTATNGEE